MKGGRSREKRQSESELVTTIRQWGWWPDRKSMRQWAGGGEEDVGIVEKGGRKKTGRGERA